jgi:lipoprotein NlpI
LRRIDGVCARFEGAWQAGPPPHLEAFLTGETGPERTELLRELLLLELHYRQARGERFTVDEYLKRFPEAADAIRRVFAQRETAEAAAGLPEDPAFSVATVSERPTPAPGEAKPRWPTVPGYEILGELGRGGMGIVYQARQTALKRVVALKMIRAGEFADDQERARFRAEAEAVARLRHPSIVQIFEVGQAGDGPFFSLEFMEGGSLDRRVRATPQPPRLAAGLVAALARAMHAAHQSGVVHRDLKPANVLLGLRPGALSDAPAAEPGDCPLAAFEPKVTDFGLAKQLDSDAGQTHTGAVLGTPSYMAPEQAEGRTRDVGPAADIYALAAILYELLTGRPPFKGSSKRETLEQVCTREPVPVRQLQPAVPRDLETICLKGLRKDPRQRYASAAALADDVQRWLDGRPIHARPVPAWERLWKWARRRPELAGLALAVVVALVGLAVGGVLYGQGMAARLARGQAINHLYAQGQVAEAAGQHLYAQGQVTEAAGQFEVARTHWEQAQGTLAADPDAADPDMARLLHEGLERVQARLKEEAERQGLLAERQQFAQRRQRFERQRDRVLFHTVSLREPDAAADAAAVRQAAPAALAVLGVEPPTLTAGLAKFRALFESDAERRRLAEQCVEVLLVWAEAELAAAGPDDGPRRALWLLDAAAELAAAHDLGATRTFHRRRAKCLDRLGRAAEARAEQQKADGLAPAGALDFFETALAEYRDNHVAEASAACARAILLQPDHFWAHYVKGLCNLRTERWGETEVELGICLGRGTAYPWLLSLRGLAYVGLKEIKRAEADFAQALADSSDPAFRAAVLTDRSQVRLGQKRLADAERDLREALALRPDTASGQAALARLLTLRDDLDGAVTQLDRAVQLRPRDPALYSQRARLHVRRNDAAAARRDFAQVIASEPPGSTSPRLVAAHVELASLLGLAGEHKAALAHCDAALALNQDYADAYRQRAVVLLKLNQTQEAGDALDRYLKCGGKPDSKIYRARGIIHLEHKDYLAAVAAYSQALHLKEDAEILTERGWAYLTQEAATPALADFDAALRLAPADANALLGRGAALVQRARLADVAEAAAAAEKALALPKPDVKRLLAGARIYARAARIVGAAKDAREAKYQMRALILLNEAMELTPAPKRPAAWRLAQAEAAFRPLQQTAGMLQLRRKYGR